MNNNKPQAITREDAIILCGFGCLLLISYKVGFKIGVKEGACIGSSVAYERILEIMMR